MNLRVLLCLATISAVPLSPCDKTDIPIMKNRDHLTCEIKGLDPGVLYVSLEQMVAFLDESVSVERVILLAVPAKVLVKQEFPF